MAFNFALRAIYHIDRTDPDDEVVESLVLETRTAGMICVIYLKASDD